MSQHAPTHGEPPGLAPGAPPADDPSDWKFLAKNLRDPAIVMLDPQGRVSGWNAGAESILGYTRAEALGLHLAAFFTPEDRAAGVPEAELRTAAERGSAEDRRWHLRKDGTRFFASGVLTALRGDAGTPRAFAKVMRDRTDARRAEEEREQLLARSQQQSHLLDLAHVLARDLDDRVTFWSAGAQALYGYRAAEAVGRVSHELLRTQFPRPLAEILAELRGRGEWQGELVHARKDGSAVVVASHWALHRDAAGTPVTVLEVNNDVTELRRAREALREADRRKDEFLAMLGHELRNPLAPILTSLQVMREAMPGGPLLAQARATIERQVQQLTRLVDDLLDVSRVAQGKLEVRLGPVDLHEVVSEAVEAAGPALDARGHRLHLSLPPGPARVQGDAARLTQVVVNLLNNAGKYTPPGGDVWLRVALAPGSAELEVSDTGLGIAPEMLPRVFDLFAQEARSAGPGGGGLGIGLTLVKRLVELHGGTVEARSEGPGRGSTFAVRLPRDDAAEPAGGAGRALETVRAARPRLRVLVVDDNADSADSLALLLRLWGHEAVAAYTAAGGLELARTLQPDVAFLDIGLPDLNGFELAGRLRAEVGGGPVLVAVSGFGRASDLERGRQAGFRDYLVKPLAPEELERLLAELAIERADGG